MNPHDSFRACLDSGFVRLVDHMGSDLSIVRAARVSYNAEWRAGEDVGSDRRLIRYLIANRHTSPFESVSFTFEVKAPIFILRQWHRHRTWSYNEVSARYTELPAEFYVPAAKDIGVQSTTNKQGRELQSTNFAAPWAAALIRASCLHAFESYDRMIEAGIPRELARSVLPMATYSHMFATVNLHNLMHFLELRLHPHSQYEIRVYAAALMDLAQSVAPEAISAFEQIIANKESKT